MPAPDASATDVASLASALRTDPVNVQPNAGNGAAADVDAGLTEIVAGSEVPMWILVAEQVDDLAGNLPAQDLLARLHSRVGEDGVYVVRVGPHVNHEYFGDDTALADQIEQNVRALYASLPTGDAGADLTHVGEIALVARAAADPDAPVTAGEIDDVMTTRPWSAPLMFPDEHDREWQPLPESLTAATVAFLVLLLCWRVVRTVAFHTHRRQEPLADAATSARTPVDLDRLRGEVDAALELTAEAQELRPDHPRWDDVSTARRAAERLRGSKDPLDVVGAWVLGEQALALVTDRRLPRRCFVNPLHQGNVATAALPVGRGDKKLDVPLCRRCREAAPAIEDALLDRARLPYFRGRTVWARTGYGALDPAPWHAVEEARR